MANKADSRQIDKTIGSALFSDTERMEMWFATYWKKAALISLGAVIVFCGLLFFYQRMVSREREFIRKISNTYDAVELQNLISSNPDSAGSVFGRYRLARIFMASKEFDKAQSVLQEVISSGKADALLLEKVRLMLGYCVEMQNKYAESAAIFQSIADDENFSFAARAEAECAAARLYIECGEVAKAEALISASGRIPETSLTSYWKMQLRQMGAALKNGEYTLKK